MKKYSILFVLTFACLVFLACSKDDPDPQFQNEFSFKIDNVPYSFSEFEISYDSLDNNVFIRKESGDDLFTFNLELDLPVGVESPMNWHDGISFFNAKIPGGNFLTVDPNVCKLTIEEHDTVKNEVKVTFHGVGLQSLSQETKTFTDGILNVKY